MGPLIVLTPDWQVHVCTLEGTKLQVIRSSDATPGGASFDGYVRISPTNASFIVRSAEDNGDYTYDARFQLFDVASGGRVWNDTDNSFDTYTGKFMLATDPVLPPVVRAMIQTNALSTYNDYGSAYPWDTPLGDTLYEGKWIDSSEDFNPRHSFAVRYLDDGDLVVSGSAYYHDNWFPEAIVETETFWWGRIHPAAAATVLISRGFEAMPAPWASYNYAVDLTVGSVITTSEVEGMTGYALLLDGKELDLPPLLKGGVADFDGCLL